MPTEKRLKMKDLPVCERPYEKMERFGPEQLSNAELLAIIIKTGSKNETSLSLAQKIIKKDEQQKGLGFLNETSLEQLMEIPGVGRVKAIQLKALAELSRRIHSAYSYGKRVVIKTSSEVSDLLMDEMRYLQKEVFKVLMLSTKNHIVRSVNVSTGSLNASIVHPREVFGEAVKSACCAIILVHNHPSGDPEPSAEDIETTVRLANAGNLIGIKVLDHVIIGDGCYVSFRERGLF